MSKFKVKSRGMEEADPLRIASIWGACKIEIPFERFIFATFKFVIDL
jgi:hypothetical protein